jgi:hypothetical protein
MKRQVRKSLSQTPSPKAERVYGSKVNKPQSSSTKSKAKSIVFSESLTASIRSKISAHNEEYPNNKVDISTAKAVVRRGMGAYSRTHRPTITNNKPNSRQAWGLARLNAFLLKKVGKYPKKSYIQDDDLL